jgi:hypothetical protein
VERIPAEPKGEALLYTTGRGFHWARMDEKGRIRPDPSPWSAFLTLGYVVTGDLNLLVRAQRQAAERVRIGTRLLKLGRDHGCSLQSQSGVARREFSALAPVTLGATLRQVNNVASCQVKYSKPGGRVGLPQGVAARFIPTKPSERKVQLYNASGRRAVVYVSPASAGDPWATRNSEVSISACKVNGKVAKQRAGKVKVEMPAGKSARVEMKLA